MNASSPALRQLMQLGRAAEVLSPDSLPDEQMWDDLNAGPDSWVSLAAALEADQIEHVTRGLILYGRATGRYHEGRTSPITWLFRMMWMNYPEREAALGAWIVANRVNPYDPFGSVDDGQTFTMNEFRQRDRQRLRALVRT